MAGYGTARDTLPPAPKPVKPVVPRLPQEFGSQTQRRASSWGSGNKVGGGKGGAAKGKASGPDFSSALYDPSKTLKGKNLYDAAKALADAQVGTAIDELTRQIARNRQQGAAAQKLTSGYFNQLGQFGQQSYQNTQQNAAQLNQQLQGIGQQGQSQIAGYGQNATGGALAGMAAQGLDGGSMARLAAEVASRQANSAQTSQTQRGFGATQGGNYSGLAASNQGTTALRGQERLGDMGRATELANFPLQSKSAALTAQRASLIEAAIGKLREGERNYGLAQQGLGIKQQSANQTAVRDAVNARLGAINAELKAAGLSETQRHNLQTEAAALQRINRGGGGGGGAGGGGGGGGNTRSNANSVNKIMSLISEARQGGLSDGEIRGFLADGRNSARRAFPRNLINQAFGRLPRSSTGGGVGGGGAGLGQQGGGFF